MIAWLVLRRLICLFKQFRQFAIDRMSCVASARNDILRALEATLTIQLLVEDPITATASFSFFLFLFTLVRVVYDPRNYRDIFLIVSLRRDIFLYVASMLQRNCFS